MQRKRINISAVVEVLGICQLTCKNLYLGQNLNSLTYYLEFIAARSG